MTLKELLVGFGTQVRSIWMIGLHAFAKRETRMYPEEPVYLPPRYRGRIVLGRHWVFAVRRLLLPYRRGT